MTTKAILFNGLFTVLAATLAGAASIQSPAPTASDPTPAPVIAAAAPPLTPEQTQFFEAKVRPVLSNKCYKCHSVDSAKVKGGLLLDSRDGWQRGGDNGAVILPGDPANSKVIIAIGYKDADLQMPPKGEKLSDGEIADLTKWVSMGAPDPRKAGPAKLTGLNDKARAHWAYQPVKNPPVPQVKDKSWIKTPVDAFILDKLEEKNMHPSHPAAPEALLRRAYYDLIGLPPTPDEVEAFLRDRSPNAFEKVVDHLLESPHYGERWGRFWLDSARYADTTGDANNQKEDYRYPYAWTYRDYVVQAFNSDKPYDQFLKEQLAADLLPGHENNPGSLAALGFLTVGKRFLNKNDTIDERIDTISKSMLGMTVSCARCHDHKFDPIPTMDYYSLHGVLTSTAEPADLPLLGKPTSESDTVDFRRKLKKLEDKDRELYFKLVREKNSEFRKKATAYLLARTYGAKSKTADLQARIKLIADNDLDRGVLTAVRLKKPIFTGYYLFSQLSDDEWKTRGPIILEQFLKGNRGGDVNPLVLEAFRQAPADSIHSMKDVVEVYGRLFAGLDSKAEAYCKACEESTDGNVDGFDPNLVELLSYPSPVEPAPKITTEHLREIAPEMALVNNQAYQLFMFSAINELELTNPASPPRAMAVVDATPHDDPVFIRGEANSRGPIAPRRFLEILSGKDRQPFKIGSGRLELAEAIASKSNPMTARVMVNRIWLHHFGEGFVRTPDDLGVQSEPPSHPELIDYLATRFMADGWSIKKMHRLIMLSSAYQQTSDTNTAYQKLDPENRLLWRANLRRLDFEAVRDTLLLFTDNLDPTVGGHPVNLTDEPYSYRRSIYGYIDRGAVPELMQQFDFSDPDRPNSHRTSTIVPQQALFFMNSPMSVDVARKVTSRPEFMAATDDPSRVRALYMVLFQRKPKASEVRLAAEFFDSHDPQKIKPLASSIEHHAKAAAPKSDDDMMMMANNNRRKAIQNEGERVDRRPLSLWEEYAQALLFTNEIAYVN